MSRLRVALVAGAVLLLGDAPAFACSCVATPLCQSIWSADAVFEATVDTIETEARPPMFAEDVGGHDFLVRLRDTRAWIGEPPTAVVTPPSNDSCGYDFKQGERYLVTAHRRPDGRLMVSACGETQPIREATQLLTFLKGLSKPSPGGRAFGEIGLEFVPFTSDDEPKTVEGATIIIDGPVQRATKTDSEGHFRFDGLPRGRYTVTAILPSDQPDLAPVEPVEFELPNEHACATPFLRTAINGRIVGTVREPDGKPVAGIPVSLRLADAPRSEWRGFEYLNSTETDAAGQFELGPLSPGKYIVGVNLDVVSDNPYAAAYAQPADGSSTSTIEVGRGAIVPLAPIVAHRLERVRLAGAALWADGNPAAGARIAVSRYGEERPLMFRSVATAASDGTFSVELLRGVRYAVSGDAPELGRGQTDVVAGEGPIIVILIPRQR